MDKMKKKATGQHRQRFHHETEHPEMPHAMNFRLMQSNHSNHANTTTKKIGDSSQWETTPTSATTFHLTNELFIPKLSQTVQPKPDLLR